MENLRSARRMELKSKVALCGGFYDETDPAFISGTDQIPDAHFNRISIIESDKLDRQLLGDCIGRFREGTPVFIDLPSPVSDPVRELLRQSGFHTTGEFRSSMMAVGSHSVGEHIESLHIEIVQPDTLDTFLELFLRGFDTPEELIPLAQGVFHELVLQHCRPEYIRMYLGTFQGEPACTEYLFFEGDEGGVNMVSTKERLRGRGLATAMVQHLMEDAFRLGVRRLSLETRWNSAPESLYQRLGFVTIARHEIFANAPDLIYGL